MQHQERNGKNAGGDAQRHAKTFGVKVTDLPASIKGALCSRPLNVLHASTATAPPLFGSNAT